MKKKKLHLVLNIPYSSPTNNTIINSLVSLMIDCHSFLSFESEDVNVCIGCNEDNSRPNDEIFEIIDAVFTKNGYKVAMNRAYANSFLPKAECDLSCCDD